MTQTYAVNLDATTFAQTYVRTATFQPGEGTPIRFSKPAAADSDGLLAWDAWSDAQDGAHWFNTMSIWGKLDGLDWTQLFNFGSGISAPYASEEEAFDALAAFFPLTFDTYDAYQIRLTQDGGVGSGGDLDNQGGVSMLVEVMDDVTYKHLIPLQPDAPIKEEWRWLTDTQVAYEGDEDRIPLRTAPRRVFSGTYSFDDVEQIRQYKINLMKAGQKASFMVPLFQYQVVTKTPIDALANYIFCNPARSDFRAGGFALITEGDSFELVVIDTVLADRIVLAVPPLRSYSARALISPVATVYTATGVTVNRSMLDDSGTVDFMFTELTTTGPFVNPLEDVNLVVFDSMFVLDNRAIGTQFEQQFDSGLIISEDYIGKADLFSPWTQGQWAFPLRWQCNRVFDIDAWFQWQRFADAIAGASATFLLPSYRGDIAITTPAAGGGNAVVFTGHDFRDYYYGLDTYARLVIESAAGRQYVKVTGITNVAGNDRVTFTPALPAGDWATDQKVGFLLKVRNVDDKVTVDHYGLHSEVSMSVRTVK